MCNCDAVYSQLPFSMNVQAGFHQSPVQYAGISAPAKRLRTASYIPDAGSHEVQQEAASYDMYTTHEGPAPGQANHAPAFQVGAQLQQS